MQTKAAEINSRIHTGDIVRLQLNDTIRFENLTLIWESFVIEDVVESDGSPGNQSISIGIKLTNQESEEYWQLLLPVSYKEFIVNQPREVSFAFNSFIFCVIDADFEHNNNSFVVIEVKTAGQSSYYIDNKPVGETEFNKIFKNLKEVDGTWYCAETKNGGETGYECKDKHGNTYRYKVISDNGVSNFTLSKK